MPLPKELQRFFNLTITSGLTTIKIDHNKNIIHITHTGNMGDNIGDIKENVDNYIGDGWFEKLEESCKRAVEAGSPDYFYTRTMWF